MLITKYFPSQVEGDVGFIPLPYSDCKISEIIISAIVAEGSVGIILRDSDSEDVEGLEDVISHAYLTTVAQTVFINLHAYDLRKHGIAVEVTAACTCIYITVRFSGSKIEMESRPHY